MMIGGTISGRSSRTATLSLQSGDTTRKRTLDNYPMQFSWSDLQQKVSSERLAKDQRAHRAKRTQATSGNLTSYSKTCFEEAVNRAQDGDGKHSLPRLHGCEPHHRHVPSYALKTSSTGPTQLGSPLYNTKADVLNSFRVRCSTSGDKERPDSNLQHMTPEIRALLQQSNLNYKVVSPSVTPSSSSLSQSLMSCSTQAMLGDFILVPMGADSVHEDETESRVESLLIAGGNDGGGDGGRGFKDCGLQSVSSFGGTPVQDNGSAANSGQLEDGQGQDQCSQGSQTLGRQEDTELHEVKTGHQTRHKSSKPEQPTDDCSAASSERSGSSGRTGGLKGHSNWCWVDDATVSSTQSRHSIQQSPTPALGSSPLPPGGKSAEKTVTFDDKVKVKDKDKIKDKVKDKIKDKDKVKDKEQTEKQAKDAKQLTLETQQNGAETNVECGQETGQVLSLEELKDKEWSLPDFICPSSETKSRQARVKDWLEKSTFTWASRSVPLM